MIPDPDEKFLARVRDSVYPIGRQDDAKGKRL